MKTAKQSRNRSYPITHHEVGQRSQWWKGRGAIFCLLAPGSLSIPLGGTLLFIVTTGVYCFQDDYYGVE